MQVARAYGGVYLHVAVRGGDEAYGVALDDVMNHRGVGEDESVGGARGDSAVFHLILYRGFLPEGAFLLVGEAVAVAVVARAVG
jgi:hypothetical protein